MCLCLYVAIGEVTNTFHIFPKPHVRQTFSHYHNNLNKLYDMPEDSGELPGVQQKSLL